MKTTIFTSGNSQCVRIPKSLRLETREVEIKKVFGGLLIVPLDQNLWDAFWQDETLKMSEDFFGEERSQTQGGSVIKPKNIL